MEFQKNKCAIARGHIRGGEFQARTEKTGSSPRPCRRRSLFFELSSGTFVVPGGMGVAIDEGSTFDVSDARVSSDGHFSGVAKLDLAGKTGELSRKGATISASDIRLKTPGLTVVDGRATGPLEISLRLPARVPLRREVPDRGDPREEADARLPRPLRDGARAQGRRRRGRRGHRDLRLQGALGSDRGGGAGGARGEVATGPGGPEHRLRDRAQDVPSLRRGLLHARDRGHRREERGSEEALLPVLRSDRDRRTWSSTRRPGPSP